MTTRIPLTRGMYALVDDEDAAEVSRCRWFAGTAPGQTTYAYRKLPTGNGKKTQPLHQFLTGLTYIDHRNGDGLDNRRSNLRPATRTQNAGNQRKTRGRSRYKGVSWIARSKVRPWVAKIAAHGQGYHLGYFATEEEAARAYDTAARRLFGEFAALNFARPGERSALASGSAVSAECALGDAVKTLPRAERAGRISKCDRGHPFDEDNTYVDPSRGRRSCRACHNLRERNRKSRLRAERRGDLPPHPNSRKTHCKYGHEFTLENTYRSPARPDRRKCRRCDADRHRKSPRSAAT